MLNLKILVCILYYHNTPYRTLQHFFKNWPKAWEDKRRVIFPVSKHGRDTFVIAPQRFAPLLLNMVCQCVNT